MIGTLRRHRPAWQLRGLHKCPWRAGFGPQGRDGGDWGLWEGQDGPGRPRARGSVWPPKSHTGGACSHFTTEAAGGARPPWFGRRSWTPWSASLSRAPAPAAPCSRYRTLGSFKAGTRVEWPPSCALFRHVPHDSLFHIILCRGLFDNIHFQCATRRGKKKGQHHERSPRGAGPERSGDGLSPGHGARLRDGAHCGVGPEAARRRPGRGSPFWPPHCQDHRSPGRPPHCRSGASFSWHPLSTVSYSLSPSLSYALLFSNVHAQDFMPLELCQ